MNELSERLQGLLGFPVTPFSEKGDLDLDTFRRQVEMLLSYGARAVFPACGTGEFQSLSRDEYTAVVAACVEQVGGRVPVLPGVGQGVGAARDMGRVVAEIGADAVLVFPPYLFPGNGADLSGYYTQVAAGLPLPMIMYQRGAAMIPPATLVELAGIPNIIGLKDGLGRVDLLLRQRQRVKDPSFVFLNGTPTAEAFAPALATCGIHSYSSAMLNFVPEFAVEFYEAMQAADRDAVRSLMDRFVVPYLEIRDRNPSYAVSLVKAGTRLRGIPVGTVRRPLVDPSPEEVERLEALMASIGLDGALSVASAHA